MSSGHWKAYQRSLERIAELGASENPDAEELERLRREVIRLADLLEEDLLFVETRRAPAPMLQAQVDEANEER